MVSRKLNNVVLGWVSGISKGMLPSQTAIWRCFLDLDIKINYGSDNFPNECLENMSKYLYSSHNI